MGLTLRNFGLLLATVGVFGAVAIGLAPPTVMMTGRTGLLVLTTIVIFALCVVVSVCDSQDD